MRWPLVRRSTLAAAEFDRDLERKSSGLLMSELATVRSTLRVVSGERDYAHLLLAVIRADCPLPDAVVRRINCAVAQESESDIERLRLAVERLRREIGVQS